MPQRFRLAGEQFNSALSSALESSIPSTASSPLLDLVRQRSLSAYDETGGFSVGANGVSILKNPSQEGPGWSLSVNPALRSAEFRRGSIGVSGGNGVAPVPSVSKRVSEGDWKFEGAGAPAPNGTGAPGAWGQVSYQVGGNAAPMAEPDFSGQLDAALRPYGNSAQQSAIPSAQQTLEDHLDRYREKNPDWYRP